MEIHVAYDYREEATRPLKIESLVRYVLEAENVPFNTEVSVSFVTDQAIAELNERFRHVEGATDVLSFPCDSPSADLEAMLGAQESVLELGDVVIAPDVAERQSAQYGTRFEEEVRLLCVHGLLHLCEYDHVDDDEAATMQARERELLAGYAKSFAC